MFLFFLFFIGCLKKLDNFSYLEKSGKYGFDLQVIDCTLALLREPDYKNTDDGKERHLNFISKEAYKNLCNDLKICRCEEIVYKNKIVHAADGEEFKVKILLKCFHFKLFKQDFDGSEEVIAKMILFSKKEDSGEDSNYIDGAFAYLFGKWELLINLESVCGDFGLTAGTKAGIFCTEKDLKNQDLKIIKSLSYSVFFDLSQKKYTENSRCGLQKFKSVFSEKGLSRIEEMEFKSPFPEWGEELLHVSDYFRFSLKTKNKERELYNQLYDKAKEVYSIFENKQTHENFKNYLGFKNSFNKKFNKYLECNFAKYYEKFYFNYEFEKLFNNKLKFSEIEEIKTTDEFKNSIIISGVSISISITINGKIINDIGRYIFSLPIEYENNFYMFERNDWFNVPKNTTKIKLDEIKKYKLNYEDLFLPSYEISKKQNENAFNEYADDYAYKESDDVKYSKYLGDSKHQITNPDNDNDKFELADLCIQLEGDRTYFIHNKLLISGKADPIYKACAQAERCANFLVESSNHYWITGNKDLKAFKKNIEIFDDDYICRNKDKINVVIALIWDDKLDEWQGDSDKIRTNIIIRLHNSAANILKLGLGFGWTIIPKV